MGTTKPATGWTRGWPENGDYWRRSDENDKPQLVHIQGATYRLLEKGTHGLRGEHTNSGMTAQIRDPESYEYLGPFAVVDFEQLAALRDASERALTWIEHYFGEHSARKLPHDTEVIAALRNALNPTNNQPKGD